MFLNDFFYILKENTADDSADFRIKINAQHSIFDGHFQGHPIVPGVCVTQIGIDLFSHLQKKEFHLHKAKNIKFLHVIEPQQITELNYHLQWDQFNNNSFRINILVQEAEITYAKIDIELNDENNGEGTV